MQLPPKAIFGFCTDGWHQELLLDWYLFCVIKVTFKPCVIKHDMLYFLRIRVTFESRQVKGNRETIYLWLPPRSCELWGPSTPKVFTSRFLHLWKMILPGSVQDLLDWNQKNQHNWLVLNSLFRKHTQNWGSKTLKKTPTFFIKSAIFQTIKLLEYLKKDLLSWCAKTFKNSRRFVTEEMCE